MTPARVTVHCTASPNGVHYPARAIRADHMRPVAQGGRGFSDIGYHFVIQPDGTVETGRPIDQAGAHVQGHNEGNVGVALVGLDRFTPRQWEALRRLLDWLGDAYAIPIHEIYTHAQWDTARVQGKSCPNISINRLLAWYLADDACAISQSLLT